MASTLIIRDFKTGPKDPTRSEEQAARTGAHHVIEAGDFRVDLDARQVKVRGREVGLTQDEFDLLAYMLKHPKQVLSVHTRFSETPAVDALQTLHSLLKKIQPGGCSHQYFQTEPWIVYRFDPACGNHSRR